MYLAAAGATVSNAGTISAGSFSAGTVTATAGSVTATVSGTGRYVNAGTVGGAVTVATGATVSGLGSLNTLTTQSGAVVNPGSALGALSVNNLSLAAGSFLDREASDAASALKRDSLTFNATSAFTGTGTVGIRLFSFNDATGVRGASATFNSHLVYSWNVLTDASASANANKVPVEYRAHADYDHR